MELELADEDEHEPAQERRDAGEKSRGHDDGSPVIWRKEHELPELRRGMRAERVPLFPGQERREGDVEPDQVGERATNPWGEEMGDPEKVNQAACGW